MFNEILDMAISNGIFAALFTTLLFYVLRDSSKREKKYQDVIAKLTTHLEIVNDIKQEIIGIKENIKNGKAKRQINTGKNYEKTDSETAG